MDKSTSKRDKKEKTEERAKGSMEDKEMVGEYILINIIGKGAFGVVWRAVHRDKGNWVAIKRVKLNATRKKNKLQLSSLMMEIDLLKSLQHPNIVHYIEHLLAEETLNIIMEYIENGSLESLLRKHGNFPESLVATYMAQVGVGLAYLHDEGVIHRDIKGANILITTSGAAKLADFGVSTKLEDITNAEDSFAGTPYWMAPEIISMSGATTACDVWSFGCTIIELLTGTPPYGNLPPAASLYRIVQDEHPPLPEGITDALKNLLLSCFQKDVDRRITAAQLMRHPWLKGKVAEKAQPIEEVKDKISKHVAESTPSRRKLVESGAFDWGEESDEDEEKENEKTKKKDKQKKNKKKKEMHKVIGTFDSISSLRSLNEPGSLLGKGSLAHLKGLAQGIPTFDGLNDEKTKPTKPSPVKAKEPPKKNAPEPKKKAPEPKKKKKSSSDEENWDDMFADDEGSVNSTASTNSTNNSIVKNSMSSVDSLNFDTYEKSDTVIKRELASTKPSVKKLFGSMVIGDSENEDSEEESSPKYKGGASVLLPLSDSLARWKETNTSANEDDLDFGEEEDDDMVLQLPAREDSQIGTVSEVDVDALFNEVFDFEEEDQDTMLQIQRMEALKVEVTNWLGSLSPSQGLDPDAIVANCDKLLATFIEQPSIKTQSVTNANIIHLLNMLDVYAAKANWRILQYILVLINEILVPNPDTKHVLQVNFCLLGGIPAVTKFAGNNYPKTIRLEAAKFIKQMTVANPLCLHMFVACGGLSVLVTLLEPNYKTYSSLVQATIDGIWAIFHLQILPKADFCHIFAKSGLLPRLSSTLVNVYKDPDAEAHLFKLADIFFYFSNAFETAVLDAMCNPSVLQSIREVVEVKEGFEVKPSYHLLWMLHAISNLSIRTTARANLAQQGFIPVLVRFLERREEFTKEELGLQEDEEANDKEQITLVKIHRWVLNALFNMCQLDVSRQEQAALSGIIPSLAYFIEEGVVYFLKELAIKIFLDMPHASEKVRNLLWRTDSFPVYMRLLNDPLWFVDTLTCLQAWLRVESDAVTRELEKNVDKLVHILSFARDQRVSVQTFLKSLDPLVLIVQECPGLSVLMVDQGVLPSILNGLTAHEHPYIRNQLLLMLLFLLVHYAEAEKQVPGKDKIVRVIKQIAESGATTGRVKDISAKILRMLA